MYSRHEVHAGLLVSAQRFSRLDNRSVFSGSIHGGPIFLLRWEFFLHVACGGKFCMEPLFCMACMLAALFFAWHASGVWSATSMESTASSSGATSMESSASSSDAASMESDVSSLYASSMEFGANETCTSCSSTTASMHLSKQGRYELQWQRASKETARRPSESKDGRENRQPCECY